MDFTTAIFILFFSLPDFRPAALRLLSLPLLLVRLSVSPLRLLLRRRLLLPPLLLPRRDYGSSRLPLLLFLFLLRVLYSRFAPFATFNCSRLVLKSVSRRAVFRRLTAD